MFTNLYRRARGPVSPSAARRPQRPSFRPGLENLEDRTVPSLFTSARAVPSAPAPYGVAVGDFNNDRFDDFATVGGGVTNPQVSIHLGNGAGQFHEPSGGRIAVDKNPVAIVAADFDDDGWPDLVVASSFSSTVTFLHGHKSGDGNFTQLGPPSPTGGTNPTSLAVGDFAHDGRRELAVTNFSSNTVTILHFNSNGSFTVVKTFTFFPHPAAVTVGDFDNDNRDDLAVANSSPTNTVILALNQKDGWKEGVTVPVGADPLAITAFDFNEDKIPDLVTANQFDNNVSVVLSSDPPGSGTFQPAVNYAVGNAPHALVEGFFYNGTADLAVAAAGGVDVLIANPAGTFRPVAGSPFPASADSLGLAAGRFDDASPSPGLVETDFANNRALVLFNLSNYTTSLTCDHPSGPVSYSDLVTFTFRVSPGPFGDLPPGDPGVPSGTVTFFDNYSTKLVTLPLVGGKVSYTTYLQPGLHSISATYSGDDTRAPGGGYLDIGQLTVTDTADMSGKIYPNVKNKHFGSQPQSTGPHVHRKVTLENTSGVTLRGPLWLVLDGLSRRIKVLHLVGRTVAHGTRRSPYVAVPLPGGVLAAGAEVTVSLQLKVPPGKKVRFRPLVLAGVGLL
jgi:hypothetical protein